MIKQDKNLKGVDKDMKINNIDSKEYFISEPFSVFWTQFREHILTSYNFTLICLYYWL